MTFGEVLNSCAASAVIAVLLLLSDCRCQQASEQLVQLDTGLVRGYIRPADIGNYTSYRGIPYAKQPIGELRFKTLELLDPWEGVYDALSEGDICMQRDIIFRRLMQPSGMSESCIHANVHVPEGATSASSLPVLVFIHGGAFGRGSSDADVYGPEYLVSRGIIVVTFNSRLNAFGYLSLATKELPGNLGMWDMVALLKWVNRNIAAFGGDPDNVTIGGQSSGGVAVHLLTLSNTTQGLFSRAIMMSGVATRSFATTSPVNAAEQTALLLTKLGINSTDSKEIFETLQSINASLIKAATTEIEDLFIIPRFQPVVENVFDGIEPFLSEDPYEIVSSGRSRDIPTIIGFTEKESNTFAPRLRALNVMSKLKTNPELLLPLGMQLVSNSTQLEDRISKIKTRYFGNEEFSNDNFNNFLEAMSDGWFIYPALELARINAELLYSSVYLYQFSFVGDYHPLQDLIANITFGAMHSQDLTYVFKFNAYNTSSIEKGTDDESIMQFITSSFVNFSLIDEPTPDVCEWPPFTVDENVNININHTLEIQQNFKDDVVQFFNDLFN